MYLVAAYTSLPFAFCRNVFQNFFSALLISLLWLGLASLAPGSEVSLKWNTTARYPSDRIPLHAMSLALIMLSLVLLLKAAADSERERTLYNIAMTR